MLFFGWVGLCPVSSLKQTKVIQQLAVDQEAVCGLVILFVVITSWFIPALGMYEFGIP